MFHKIIRRYLQTIWLDSAKFNNQIIIYLIKPDNNLRILDIGCSDGKNTLARFKNIRSPHIFGIDIEKKSVRKAQSLGITALQADIEKGLPFKSNFFDIICANQIIEHLYDIDLFTSEIKRVLKPNGYLVLSTENLSSWHNIFALFLGWQAFSQHLSLVKNIGNPIRLGNYQGYDESGMHTKIFTPRGLRELFETYDFKIEEFFGAGYYPFFSFPSKILSKIDPTHTAFIGLKARNVQK